MTTETALVCYWPGCGEDGAYWLLDTDEPKRVYSVCLAHARVYEEHIKGCDEAPCEYRLGAWQVRGATDG